MTLAEINIVSPPEGIIPGNYQAARDTPLVFKVTKIDPAQGKVTVSVKISNQEAPMVVFDGTNFVFPFATNSTRTPNTSPADGWTFSVLPIGGWTGGVTLEVTACLDLETYDTVNTPPGVGIVEDYPTSAINMVASGLPEPTHIWAFQESSGDLIDLVGSLDLTLQGIVTQSSGGPVGRDAYLFGASDGRAESPTNTDADYSGQSIRIGAVIQNTANAGIPILVNANPTTFEGYWFYRFNQQPTIYVESSDGLITSTLNSPTTANGWTHHMSGINLNNNMVELQQGAGGPTGYLSAATSVVDWVSSSGKLVIGGFPGWGNPAGGLSVTYIVMWVGAAAETDFTTTYNTFVTRTPLV